jgi:hypothetical protein
VFLSIVHLRERRCPLCNALLATAGARSFIVDSQGDPVAFATANPPAQMQLEMRCENGHIDVITVPGEASAEESIHTPDDAPIALDAVYRGER